jgi:Fe-S-cluster containining protein
MGASNSPQAEPMLSDSRFSYDCLACGRCCAKKSIKLNPFEIAMLAKRRGISTTELMVLATDENAPVLRTKQDGFCIFYQAGPGCTVHSARPLACRLYPLGMHRQRDAITYSQLEPHPQTEGIYGDSGTVADFIAGQGVAEYTEGLEAYLTLIKDLYGAWSAKSENKVLPSATDAFQADLLDIDGMLPDENRNDAPRVKAERHIAALRARFNLAPGCMSPASEPTADALGAAISTLVYSTGITIAAKSDDAPSP